MDYEHMSESSLYLKLNIYVMLNGAVRVSAIFTSQIIISYNM
jgi:hypothetical protein